MRQVIGRPQAWQGLLGSVDLLPLKARAGGVLAGIGGSWFLYGGNFEWAWQRDWFDFGNAAALFMEMMTDGTLSEGMTARMERSLKPGQLPGHYQLADTPVGLWEMPS